MEKLTFKKSERLSQKKLIQELFDRGSSFYLYPFKIIIFPSERLINQVIISVPKSIFKRAIDRNKIKRRIREGYRLNKTKLPAAKFFFIAYIYTAKEILPSAFIHQKMVLSFDKIMDQK
jgi:ribonuclease P protein component